MWWLPRRPGFDIRTWEPKCACKHEISRHRAAGSRSCRGCGCGAFVSDFACVVCDRKWEAHATVWEDAAEREAAGRPVDAAWLPLAEVPEMQTLVFAEHMCALNPASAARVAPRDGR